MLGKSVSLFRLLGFEVRVDVSWLFLAVLVTWSLAQGLFPYFYAGLSAASYWWMAAVGASGLFLSIVFHEFCHSLVAREFGLPIKGITLFIFGGVAEMEEEPPSARAEFWMAIAGPISSFLLAGVFFLFSVVGEMLGLPVPVLGVTLYLAAVNGVLATFNLLPAFPLDGGRMFRAALWHWKGDLRWATRLAATVGSGFGLALIALGLFSVFSGNFVGGMWWFLIGLFLRGAASASYMQLQTRRALEGEPVSKFMTVQTISVPLDITIRELVEDYVYRYHHGFFPVMAGERLVGCVNTWQIKEVPRDRWGDARVKDVFVRCSKDNTISADTDAVKALSVMRRTGTSRLLIAENGRLIGIVSLKDLLNFLALKMDLEGLG